VTCIACTAGAASPIYDGLLMRCGSCGHVWADADLTAADVQALYGRSYFHGDEYSDYLGDRPSTERNFAARLADLERHLDPRAHRRLFEIGCAYGLFLHQARARFEHVAGIDITDEGVEFARTSLGLDVQRGDFLEADVSGQRFDVVCAWDTIEHLARPADYVQKAALLMPPGGVLALTTGDIGSLNARLRGPRWRLIHPPTHLHYFSVPSMTRMLDRLGFDVIHTAHIGSYRRVGNMLHNIVALRWGHPAAGQWLADSWLSGINLFVNLFDVMSVVARKR